ncbi:EAL domain-containing protein [Thiolapillus sp.]
MLSNYLDNLKIRHKLLVLLVFPFAVLMLFTGYEVAQKWHQWGEVKQVRELYEAALDFSDVIHALQKERGLAAGYLGSKGDKFRQELDQQWAETDRLIRKARFFDTQGPLFDGKFARIGSDVSGFTDTLKYLQVLRDHVDGGMAEGVFEHYSTIIANAINLIENIGVITEDAVLARNDQIYGILLRLQEFASRERGLVNALLSSGKIDHALISGVIFIQAEQDSLRKRLKHAAAATMLAPQMEGLRVDPVNTHMREMREALSSKMKKLDVLDQVAAAIGYGGLVHQFKDYIIRGDEVCRARFVKQYARVQEYLDSFLTIPNLTEEELADIGVVKATFEKYHSFLPVIGEMHERGAAISSIDMAVKVDDSVAIAALENLRVGVPAINPGDWFRSATDAINLLKTASDSVRQQSLLYIGQKTSKTLFALAGYALLAAIVTLLSFYLGVVIARRLTAGTMEISRALQQLEDSGDFSGRIRVYGNDEIAAMGRSFNSLIEERREAERRLYLVSRVFDSTADGIVVTNPEQEIVLVNRATTEITGFSEEELVGKTPRVLSSGRHDKEFYQAMWKTIAEKGSWQGDIWNRRKSGEVYPQWQNISEVRDEKGRLLNYISVFSDISAIMQSQAQLEHLAHHDPLTGLPNRLLLDQHLTQGLERAYRQHQLMAVLFLDLDRFKNVNDSLGHLAGDALLKQVSQRLKQLVRGEDLVARLGGDEFAIVLEAPADALSVGMVAQKCIDAFAEPFMVDNSVVYVSTSIGISIFPDDGAEPADLIKHADTAMYHVKECGRNAFQFYNRQMTEQAVHRLTLENELREAINNQDFTLYYQPQVSLDSGRIIGAEALIRWRKSTGEFIAPDIFVPVAEESGLIEYIDRWVLQKACLEMAHWQQQGAALDFIAVNISGFSIEHGLLIEMVENALQVSRMAADCLELEITEGYLMEHKGVAVKLIDELRKLGVKFSIDDFGTGYSSLSYLKTLPVNKLKVDRSFIRDIQSNEYDKAIAMSVIALGHSMQMEVIAEGVEVEEQAKILSSLGCDSVQGYFYSKPVPADIFLKLLQKQQ